MEFFELSAVFMRRLYRCRQETKGVSPLSHRVKLSPERANCTLKLQGNNSLGGQMGTIEEHFSTQAKLILQRRAKDVELDEMCRDFELLAADLEKQSPQNSTWKAELECSLVGLKKEILSKIGPA